MSEDELIRAVGRLRRRLRRQAHLFEDPRSYVDGVEDALELVEHTVSTGHDEAVEASSDDGLERTA